MTRYFLLFTLGVLFVACTKSSDSSAPAPSSVDKNQNRPWGIACGDLACDPATEYCYQVIKAAQVIEVSDCGPQPGSPCTIWQKDIGNGQLEGADCVKRSREKLTCTGPSGAAADAVEKHPDICRSGSLGCENDDGVTVSCFVK